jgi:hypothetical protein
MGSSMMSFYVYPYSNLLVPHLMQPNHGNLNLAQCGKGCGL